MSNREKFKILSFVTLFKMKRENSMLYTWDSGKQMAKDLNMSYNTFKKYKNTCIDLNIFSKYGSHLQLKKLTVVIKQLELKNLIGKYNRFYKYTEYKKISFKNIYNKIIDSVIINNFRQQEYNISKKEYSIGVLMGQSNSNLSHKAFSVLKKLKKKGISLKSLQKSTNHSIVTGKNHISNLIGLSSTTGARWLRKAHEEGIIDRKIISVFIDVPFSNEGFDCIVKEKLPGIVVPVRKFKRFVNCKGSAVTLLQENDLVGKLFNTND